MKAAKRWGVMALVAMLVLGSEGAALADDATELELAAAQAPLEQGSYPFALEFAEDLLDFVFYWGLGDSEDPPPCETPESDPGGGIFFQSDEPVEKGDCFALNVEGPNGQVNHGSMVSSFVHWLKDGGAEMLPVEVQALPKGQLVKRFAQEDFGKGVFDLDGEDEGPEGDFEADDGEGNGPPDWVKAKKAAKAEAKPKK